MGALDPGDRNTREREAPSIQLLLRERHGAQFLTTGAPGSVLSLPERFGARKPEGKHSEKG
jgi:hypothetical protein